MSGEGTGQLQQRIRIGLTGLAFVFLLVLLGTAISRSGEKNSGPDRASINVAAPDEPSDPLAEIGAAPGQGATNDSAAPAAPAVPPPAAR